MLLLYWKEICIWFIRIEYFITVHYCNKILRFTKIDNIVCIARQHMNTLNIVTRYLEFQYLI